MQTSFDIKEPGLNVLPLGVERHIVNGGGLTGLQIFPEDEIEIINNEGNQICEISVFNKDGKSELAILNLKENKNSSEIKKILLKKDESSLAAAYQLKKRNLDIDKSKSAIIFDKDTSPDEKIKLKAKDKCYCIFSAPGPEMIIHEQNPTTDLTIFIKRAKITKDKEHSIIPDPIFDPLSETNINRKTAISFQVKEGDYIQVISPTGRQCSDFVAFDTTKLDKKIEKGLDWQTTRTFMGNTFPGPGLFSKFYDTDHEPLVEVIRDTVGRHDTFNLACTPKYYEDSGYFGHPNCSDNLNETLEKFGVQKRKGWHAINLFFNTSAGGLNSVLSDESFARPGDYVMFKALKDLTCGTTACPSDIDPCNSWNPTDIFVRTYDKKREFRKSFAFRMKTDSETKLTRNTGFYERTSKLTRNFVDARGFWLPNDYTKHGIINEHTACREKAVVIDLSSLRKFEILGPDAEELMNYTLTRNVKKLSVGQVVYSSMCYENGTMFDDGTLLKLSDQGFRWVCGDEYAGQWLKEQAKKKNYKVLIKDSTDQINNISLQGPNSRKILEKIIFTPPTQPSISELQWFRFTICRLEELNGIPLMVSRTGYTGELGYEIWCHPSDAPKVWDKVMEAGKDEGLIPAGFAALDLLRIEAGLILFGNEFDGQIDPFEAGVGFTVPLKTKTDDFIGKENLIKRKENPQKKLVGLELISKEKANHGDCVHIGRAQVGIITSGCISPTLNKNIALCRMDIGHSEIGTEVEVGKIDGEQKRIPAKVVGFPHYDPQKTRVRA
ncbi:MAG TPA: glycine cleavage system aminomethyltransferase GcvT [Candidatus Pelagibacter bacterium]|nr:glycine cleavage system aminomethyltransferase GcvT [Candidatus Pelagibacter bacterium]